MYAWMVLMARKKSSKKKTPTIPALVKEHNLTERWHRGELVIEVGEDPDNPKQNVTRLRRKCAYLEMWNRGSITTEQCQAAEQYVSLCEKSLGASGDIFAKATEIRTTRQKWEPTVWQHEAYQKLFDIWKELGKFHTDILNQIVLQNMNCVALAQKIGWSRNYTNGLVMSVFIRLEEIMEE